MLFAAVQKQRVPRWLESRSYESEAQMRHAARKISQSLAFLAVAATAEPVLAGDMTSQSSPDSYEDMLVMQLAHGGGMWAYYTPKNLHGEFDDYDPMGLIAGALIKTDCAVNWMSQRGKRYCFSTEPSLLSFEEWPQRNIAKAEKAWEHLSKAKPQS